MVKHEGVVGRKREERAHRQPPYNPPTPPYSHTRTHKHLFGHAILLHERFFSMMEHEGIVGGERDVETARKELVEGILGQAEEEGVVGERGEGQTNLKEWK
jgi:hypothetical protein